MCWQHDQSSVADEIAIGAVNSKVGLGVAGNSTVILLVASVAEEDNALGLVDDCSGERGDCACDERCALADCILSLGPNVWGEVGMGLPVATGDNSGVGALCVCKVEEASSFGDSSISRSLGLEVVEDSCGVGSTDTLYPDICSSVVRLKCVC